MEQPQDLRSYFREVYKPTRLADRNPIYVEQYESAINCLYHFLGNEPELVLVDAIHESDLDDMKAALMQEEYAAITVTKYRWLLRSVLRHAKPEAFPKMSGRWSRTKGAYAPVDAPGTLWSFYQHTYRPYHMVGRSKEYEVQIEVCIRFFCRFAKHGSVGLTDLSDELLMEFAQHLLDIGRAMDTAKNKVEIIRRLWRFAVRKKLLQQLPDTIRLPSLLRQPTAWTMEQVGKVLRTCQETPGTVGKLPAGPFWCAVVMLAYDSGLRLRACFGIKRADLDRKSRWLTVPAENMKNRREQRFILHPDTIAAIDAIWEPQRIELFPWPHCHRSRQKAFRQIIVRAGLWFSRRDGMHKIRRTSATHLAALVGIGEATRHLGHSHVSTTMRYIDQTMMPAVRAGDILPRPVMPAVGKKGGAV